ncbi:MAG: tRNA guanosine(34) transglycosylase Tgt, partial [Chloroflexota bacterium]|nr:tRNA guanosine(34) transglycosylase Tgt [Chloroflexota bacterium]
EELLGYRLATIHNLRFILRLMEDMRGAIIAGAFPQFKDDFLAGYKTVDDEIRTTQKAKWLRAQRAKSY